MIRTLCFHWHRFWEWADGRLADGFWRRGNLHHDRSIAHASEADRIDSDRGRQ